jgi:hypothetical protein
MAKLLAHSVLILLPLGIQAPDPWKDEFVRGNCGLHNDSVPPLHLCINGRTGSIKVNGCTYKSNTGMSIKRNVSLMQPSAKNFRRDVF